MHGSMDLRFDLALRSSFFPGLIEEAQKLLGREVAFEDLLQVSTIADLERLFSGDLVEEGEEKTKEPMGRSVHRPFLACCVRKDVQEGESTERFRELPSNPCQRKILPSPSLEVVVVGQDDCLLASMVGSIASWKCSFTLCQGLPETRAVIAGMGGQARETTDSLSLLSGKTDWNLFTDAEKTLTENTVLLVSLLYQMCKVQLVLQSQKEGGLNQVNHKEITKASNNAEKFLEEKGLLALA